MAAHPNGVWIWNLSQVGNDYLDKLVAVKTKRGNFSKSADWLRARVSDEQF